MLCVFESIAVTDDVEYANDYRLTDSERDVGTHHDLLVTIICEAGGYLAARWAIPQPDDLVEEGKPSDFESL